MNALALAIFILAAPPVPNPYVNVYHDDAVAFQVRRDHITIIGDNTYNVRLRWLWAEPRQWKGDYEVARVIVSDVDCNGLRVRELGILRRNREGKIFDREEIPSEQAQWKQFDRATGAGAAIRRLCDFLPELYKAQP